MALQPPAPVQGRSGALLYVVSSVTVVNLSLALQYQGRKNTRVATEAGPLPHRNKSYSPILSALTVGTDCGCCDAQCCGYNGYCNAAAGSEDFTQKFTATLSLALSGCACHINIEDLGQNANFYMAFTA